MIFDFSLPNNFAKDSPKKDLALPEGANGLVVHCCCAPCSTSLVECLIFNKIKPLMFFYNPNIYPLEEYEKRRDEYSRYGTTDEYGKQYCCLCCSGGCCSCFNCIGALSP